MTNAAQTEAAEIHYGAGDCVHVRAWDAPGHLRTPWYVRGHSGIIERYCGTFRNPEELAYGRPGLPAQPLYRVRFLQSDLWPSYSGCAADTLDVEIYQHWLESAAQRRVK